MSSKTWFRTVAWVLILSFLLPALGFAPRAAAQTGTSVPGGAVSGTWAASGSPYLVEGDITVPAGQTLTIEPGVSVIFQSWYAFYVNGTLLADGTAASPILFTAATPQTPNWLGIRFVNASAGSRLTYAIVEYGQATGASPLSSGGGVYVENSDVTISYSTIRNNLAKSSGGGLYLTGANAQIIGNTIVDNQAGQGGSAAGGGLYLINSTAEIRDNVFQGNGVYVAGSYSTPSGSGGAIFARSSNPVISGNLFANNYVDGHLNSYARGGALYLYYADADIVGNTFVGNSSGLATGGVYDVDQGGAIYTYFSEPVLVNNIFRDDTPQEIFATASAVAQAITIAYSDVQGGQAGLVLDGTATVNWLQGNLDADPLFTDPAAGDYTLQAGSPAIDAGTAYFEWQGRIVVDLQPGQYNGAAPDQGAFEAGSGGGANQPPIAVASASPDHGSAPLTVQFDAAGSSDPDGSIVAYAWNFGDGSTAVIANPSHTYDTVGTYQATLTVTDDDGASHSDSLPIDVVDGTTIWGGDVSGTWTAAGSPYLVEGDITVPAGQTLTIEPGVSVIFQSWYAFYVNGTLLADGTAASPILFTAATPQTPNWLGIRFVNASAGSRLTYAIVEYGQATGASPLSSGGGIYVENSDVTISYSTIRNNLAKSDGGGIYLTGANAQIIGNTIVDNQAGQGGSAAGGGIFLINSTAEIRDNVFQGNGVYVSGSFSTPSGSGGAIFARSSNPIISGNLFVNNYVDGQLNSYARGGALYLYYADADIVGNTFVGNSSGLATGGVYDVDQGGAIYAYHSQPVLVNNIFRNDTPQEIFATASVVAQALTIAYSNVQGGQAGLVLDGTATVNWLQGNLDADPLFTNPAAGDYTLQAGSPAIDAGTAYFEWQGRIVVDLQPGQYNGAAPDQGAFEAEGSGTPNQPPVAVASANPQNGSAPLAVQFSSQGSSDPDGSIVAYAWDLGDGSTSSEANPVYVYNNAGSYQVTLTVTDDQGATASDSLTIQVASAAPDTVHVLSQQVSRRDRRNWVLGIDVVYIVDQNGNPVAGATVVANYDGPNQGQASGTTDQNGRVRLRTQRVQNPQGIWCFEIVNIVADGYIYDAAANVVTIQCETQAAPSLEPLQSSSGTASGR